LSRRPRPKQPAKRPAAKATGRTPKLLVINPGSTSTKIAVFVGRRLRFQVNIEHPRSELVTCKDIVDEAPYRKRLIERHLAANGYGETIFDAYVGRGGLLRPLAGGCWEVNEAMLEDLRSCRFGRHPCNLGAILADAFARPLGRPAYIVDPVVVDELDDVARLSGHPDLPRRTTFHALSQKAVARKIAARLGRPYGRCNLIIAHLGGGISIGAHRQGRVIEVNNALDGEGPYGPQRTGGLPLLPFLRLFCERKWSLRDAEEQTTRCGGLTAYLGTNDGREIERRIAAGDNKARLVYDGVAYQVAVQIGACAAALRGRVDAIGLTGGLSRSRYLVRRIRARVGWIAPLYVYAKMEEMQALADGVLEVLEGRASAKRY